MATVEHDKDLTGDSTEQHEPERDVELDEPPGGTARSACG